MSKKVVFILPYMNWVVSRSPKNTKYDFVKTYQELENYSINDRIIVDVICPFESTNPPIISTNTPERVREYLKHFSEIILINSDYIGGEQSTIVDQCSRMDFPNVTLITTGTINYNPTAMKIVRYENFFVEVQNLYQRAGFEHLDVLNHTDQKPYYFDALLGLERKHRHWLKNQINLRCEDKIYTRYYRDSNLAHSDIDRVFDWPSGATAIDTTLSFSSVNKVNYHGIECNLSFIVPIEVYNRSSYSIIAETCCYNDFCMYTEKTAKPLLAKRLFIFFAGRHYLENLKLLGFKTFDSIIDESYDNEFDDERRWAMAFDQVMYLCGQDQTVILEKIKPIVEHNYDLFISNNWRYNLLN